MGVDQSGSPNNSVGGQQSPGLFPTEQVVALKDQNGNQLLGNRVTGWNAPTGTQTRGTFDAAATLAVTAQTLVALIADLRAHGVIGT